MAFFFLFFLHGLSIGNGQQGISYNGLQIGGRFNAANVLLAAVFFSLIFSTLENKLKISLKKFAVSK